MLCSLVIFAGLPKHVRLSAVARSHRDVYSFLSFHSYTILQRQQSITNVIFFLGKGIYFFSKSEFYTASAMTFYERSFRADPLFTTNTTPCTVCAYGLVMVKNYITRVYIYIYTPGLECVCSGRAAHAFLGKKKIIINTHVV